MSCAPQGPSCTASGFGETRGYQYIFAQSVANRGWRAVRATRLASPTEIGAPAKASVPRARGVKLGPKWPSASSARRSAGRDELGEPVHEIARSYNVSHSR